MPAAHGSRTAASATPSGQAAQGAIADHSRRHRHPPAFAAPPPRPSPRSAATSTWPSESPAPGRAVLLRRRQRQAPATRPTPAVAGASERSKWPDTASRATMAPLACPRAGHHQQRLHGAAGEATHRPPPAAAPRRRWSFCRAPCRGRITAQGLTTSAQQRAPDRHSRSTSPPPRRNATAAAPQSREAVDPDLPPPDPATPAASNAHPPSSRTAPSTQPPELSPLTERPYRAQAPPRLVAAPP